MHTPMAQKIDMVRKLKQYQLILAIVILLILVLSSCKTKNHVITEWDGDREIRWYSTDEPNSPQVDIREWYKEDTIKTKKQ